MSEHHPGPHPGCDTGHPHTHPVSQPGPTPDDGELRFERRMLERLDLATTRQVKRPIMVEMIEDMRDLMMDTVTIEFRTEVYAERLADDVYCKHVTFEEPASTWQMFKRTHAASWWLRWLVDRRPVRTVTHRKIVKVEVTRYGKYPDAQLPDHRLGPMVPFDMVTGPFVEDRP